MTYLSFYVQTVAILVNASASVGSGGAQFSRTVDSVGLLEGLGKAVAEGAEADEDLDGISAGSIDLKVTSCLCEAHLTPKASFPAYTYLKGFPHVPPGKKATEHPPIVWRRSGADHGRAANLVLAALDHRCTLYA